MFTGIIQKTARGLRFARRGSGAVLAVENPWGDLPQTVQPEPGESISVNGACLTVVSANRKEISFDMSPETLKKTNLTDAWSARPMNLERSLRAGSDVSGHFVTGHVDGVGRVLSLERSGDFATLSVSVTSELAIYIVPKGSVAVEGVSLTVASMEGDSFSVALIPATLARTSLAALSTGDGVNIETDLLGKYVIRYLSAAGEATAGNPLTLERLKQAGF